MWLHSVCHFSFPLSKVFLLFSGGARLDKSDALRVRLHSLPGFLCYFVLTSPAYDFPCPPVCATYSTRNIDLTLDIYYPPPPPPPSTNSSLTPVSLYMIPLYFFWPPLNFLPNDSPFLVMISFFFRLRTLYMCCGRCLYMCVSPFYLGRHPCSYYACLLQFII